MEKDTFSFYELNISSVKKERLKRLQKQATRERLREDLPVLTKKEIRRYRLPHHEALLLELEEENYKQTAIFIKQLFQYQENIRKKTGPDGIFWQCPQLLSSKKNLEFLSQSLKKAEAAHNTANFGAQWDEMLALAAHYAFGDEDWWWLGEQLLFQCVTEAYPEKYQKQETISHYLLGKYLLQNGKKADSGKHYLGIAREVSKGKSWSCDKMFKQKQDTIFIEACNLLCQALMDEAMAMMAVDPEKALEVCTNARKRATEACNRTVEFQAIILKAKCEMILQNTLSAVATTIQALNKAVRRKDVRAICEATITLALVYLQHEKPQLCLECLKDLKNLAEEHNLPYYKAEAFRYMGEYYLTQGNPEEATPLLVQAFHMFNEIEDTKKREKVRTWAAISAGEELFPCFIELIKKCDGQEHSHGYLMKLIDWIDARERFWDGPKQPSFLVHKVAEQMPEEEPTPDPLKNRISFFDQISIELNKD